jgi:peroxiredoxin
MRIVAAAAFAGAVLLSTPAAAQSDHAGQLRALNLAGYPPHELAPVFTALTAEGRRLSLVGLRGHVVVLTFWATWCEPCRDEMRLLEELHRDLGGTGLVIVGVTFRESTAAIAGYARSLSLTFPLASDERGEVSRTYGVVGLPTTFVIARDGRAIARAVGVREWTSDAARALVRALLAEAGPRR